MDPKNCVFHYNDPLPIEFRENLMHNTKYEKWYGENQQDGQCVTCIGVIIVFMDPSLTFAL